VKADALRRCCLSRNLPVNLVSDDQEGKGMNLGLAAGIGVRASNSLSKSTFTHPK
jgi:hypothetical protein